MKQITSSNFLIFIFLLLFAPQLLAADLPWQDMKDFPPGAKVEVISGDPAQTGAFTLRMKLPPNYIVPAHSHRCSSKATVISGVYYIGTGNVADGNIGKPFSAGNSFVIPANNKHYGWTKKGAVLQIEATGPWDIDYAANG
ncbi:MAG: cupin domain-containing protein [Pseudomonadota bacterium]